MPTTGQRDRPRDKVKTYRIMPRLQAMLRINCKGIKVLAMSIILCPVVPLSLKKLLLRELFHDVSTSEIIIQGNAKHDIPATPCQNSASSEYIQASFKK